MLQHYKETYKPLKIQYLLADPKGTILESDGVLFSNIIGKSITEIDPFFESFISLIKETNKQYTYACIHLTSFITDVTLQTFEPNQPVLIIICDLTKHYQQYQISAQQKNEVVITSELLKLKNGILQEREAFKNTFIANFSHEIRNPLSGIITFTEFLLNTNLTNEQKDYVNLIASSSEYLKKIINDILDISKIESGKLAIIDSPFNLKELLENLVLTYSLSTHKKGLKFFYNFDEKVPKLLMGDKVRLQQILTNLLDNAVSYTNTGSVTFNVKFNYIRAKKANINFEVIDTGIGIREDKLDDIFESFYKIDNAENSNGTGLGLAIIKHLVLLLDGKVFVDSKLGKGSTFCVNLTFKTEFYKKNNTPETTSYPEINFNPKNHSKYSILLVEDSEITQLAVLKILAQQGIFYVDIVSHAKDVIPRITEDKFHLILMDINLNGGRGDNITKSIRAMSDRRIKTIPIVALTGITGLQAKRALKKSGINDLVEKPFNKVDLLSVISKYLN